MSGGSCSQEQGRNTPAKGTAVPQRPFPFPALQAVKMSVTHRKRHFQLHLDSEHIKKDSSLKLVCSSQQQRELLRGAKAGFEAMSFPLVGVSSEHREIDTMHPSSANTPTRFFHGCNPLAAPFQSTGISSCWRVPGARSSTCCWGRAFKQFLLSPELLLEIGLPGTLPQLPWW